MKLLQEVPVKNVYWVPYTTNTPWGKKELDKYIGAAVIASNEHNAIIALQKFYEKIGFKILEIGEVKLHETIHVIEDAPVV